jgi:citrate lyase subunit beta/citryl-CoA lyase
MRSLLFAPADSDRKLDKAFASGTDAVIIDLEDSVALDNKPLARERAARFLMQAGRSAQRPRLIIRVNSLPSGLADADLDAVVPAAPDAILLPKSEGAASVIHLAAKLTAREAIHGLADGHIRIIAIATETAAALFRLSTYAGSSTRLVGLTWGAEDLSADLGAPPITDRPDNFLSYRLARTLCLAGAVAGQIEPIDTVYVDFQQRGWVAA